MTTRRVSPLAWRLAVYLRRMNLLYIWGETGSRRTTFHYSTDAQSRTGNLVASFEFLDMNLFDAIKSLSFVNDNHTSSCLSLRLRDFCIIMIYCIYCIYTYIYIYICIYIYNYVYIYVCVCVCVCIFVCVCLCKRTPTFPLT